VKEPDPIDELRAGDERAFESVFRRYRPRVYSFLLRLTGQAALAEDLLQETFLRLSRKASDLRADTRLCAWLFTVARNLVFDERRRALLSLDRISKWREWRALDGGIDAPVETAAGNEAARRLEEALCGLPLLHREILLLCGVEGFEPAEAAEILGLSAEAVRKRLSRAREALRGALSMQEGANR
jgi:RNA polymerase sigma-70 factor (ECF subfamily)